MKKILVIVLLIFAFGCSDDATGPEPHEIVGKWKMSSIVSFDEEGERINVLLVVEFIDNGTFKIYNEQPTEEVFNEQGKYTIKDDIITINNNKCDTDGGRYKFVFRDNGVEFTQIEDECNYNNLLGTFFLDYDVVNEE